MYPIFEMRQRPAKLSPDYILQISKTNCHLVRRENILPIEAVAATVLNDSWFSKFAV